MSNNPPNYDIYSLLQLNEDGKPSQNPEESRPPHQWIDHQITIAQSHDPGRRPQIHELNTYLKDVPDGERDDRFYKLLSNSRDELQQPNQRKQLLFQALTCNWDVTVDTLYGFFEEDPPREVLEQAKALSSDWTWNDCQEALGRAREERKTNAGRGIRKKGGWLARDIKRAKELLEEENKRQNRPASLIEIDSSPDSDQMSATGNDTSSVNSPVGRAEFVPRPTRGKKRKTPAHLVQSPRPPAYQLDLPALLSTSPLPENIIQQALEDLDQVTPAAFQVVYATNAGLPQSERLLFPIADADGLWTLGFMDKRLQTIFIYNPRLISKPEAGIAKVNTMLNTTSYSIVRTAPVLCEEDNDSGVILLASAFYIAVGHRIPPCLNLDYWRCFLYSFLKTLHDKNVDTATQLSNGHLGYRGDASSSILELCRAWLRRETCLSESALDVSKIIASIETNKNQYPEKYVTSLKKAKTCCEKEMESLRRQIQKTCELFDEARSSWTRSHTT